MRLAPLLPILCLAALPLAALPSGAQAAPARARADVAQAAPAPAPAAVRVVPAADGALPAAPGEIVSPEAFRTYAEGHTLYFERDGQPFGAESFGKGGRTEWQFQDGTCTPGVWRPHGAQVCFYYGDGEDVQCWRMTRLGDAIEAELLSDGPEQGLRLTITRRDRTPLLCAGTGIES